MTGQIHSIESFGAADGPGVRSVVFLHGCVFRCIYCHNPDTWASPAAAEMTVDEVLERLLRFRDYWGNKGGITLSGGEPMLQAEFSAALFGRAKELGITTCLDTAAGPFRRDDENILRLLEVSDTVLLDIKAFDSSLHRSITGVDNAAVLDCARYLDESAKPVWIRRVIIPGFTDGEEDLRLTGAFIKRLSNVERVEVLPYHDLGAAKWNALGLDYALEGVQPVGEDALARARKLLDGAGI